MKVTGPWVAGSTVLVGSGVRFRMTWTRSSTDLVQIGIVMFNPGLEGEALEDGSIRDGATHRRVRALLAGATEFRVANLSPVRTTKPVVARLACKALIDPDVDQQQADALAWACEAPVVVAAWGAGPFTARMERSRAEVVRLARGRLWCWGTTREGHPLHPSPLGRVGAGAELVRWSGDI